MSKCDLTLRLQESHATLGGEIEGILAIAVNDDGVRANHVEIALQWRTLGRGKPDVRSAHEVQGPAGTWKKGTTVEVPFRLLVPRVAPPTAQGAIVGVEWFVQARVELPWQKEETVEAIVVVTGAPGGAIVEGPLAPETTDVPLGDAPGCATLVQLPFLAAGAWAARIGIVEGKPAAFLFGAFFVVAALGAAIRTWHHAIGLRVVRRADLDLRTPHVLPGETVTASLQLPARTAARVQAIDARLVALERAVDDRGESPATYTERIHDTALVVTDDGAPGRYTVRGAIPGAARPSMQVRNSAVVWQLRVTARLKGMPDPTWTRTIVVGETEP